MNWQERAPIYMCFIDAMEPYAFVCRTHGWTAFASFAVPSSTIGVVCQFHDRMRSCVRLNDTKGSDMLGCVLAPLLFNMCFGAVMRVEKKRANAKVDTMDSMVTLLRTKEKGHTDKGEERAGQVDWAAKQENASTL